MIKRKWLLGGAVVALIGAVVLARGIWSTDGAAARAPQARAVPVETAVAERKTMPVRLTALGNVTPIASVAIKTQVDTTITAVHFRDGATVQKGDLLFTLPVYGLRNTVLLPQGWEVSTISQSGTIGSYRNRVFVSFINLNSENNYRITIRARRANGK